MLESAPKYSRVVRESILERDNYECQGCGIFEGCDRREPERIPARIEDRNGNGGRVQIHHIIPQMYGERLGIEVNYPSNMIALCKFAHVGHDDAVHPDMNRAGIEYNEGNKNAYKEAIGKHEELLDRREIYWNDRHDRKLSVQAVRNTQRRIKEGWRWIIGD